MNLKLPPQSRQILDHLITVGSISGVEAAAIYKCRALPRRILDIKEAIAEQVPGASLLRVESQTKTDNTGQRYVRYVLHDPRGALTPSEESLKKAA